MNARIARETGALLSRHDLSDKITTYNLYQNSSHIFILLICNLQHEEQGRIFHSNVKKEYILRRVDELKREGYIDIQIEKTAIYGTAEGVVHLSDFFCDLYKT